MTTNVTLSGTLTSAPATATDSTFPAATDQIPIALNPAQKPYNVNTGQTININSPGALVTIPGIGGAVGPVTQGQLLYMRTTTPMKVQKTYGSTVVGPEPWSGLMVVECDPSNPLTLLQVQGVGTIEYWVCGLQ